MPYRNTYRGFLKFASVVGLELESFQRRIVRSIFEGPREHLVLLPKGNGKTTLMAAVALHHLLAHPEPSIYCGAASVAQARVLFEAARDLSLRLPPDQQVVIRSLELRREDGGGVLRMVPSDGPRSHGISPTLGLVDEQWAHRDGQLYESMRSAMVKRAEMRLVVISTADVGEERPLVRLRARALAQPSVKRIGPCLVCEGPSLKGLLWEVPAGTGADDLAAVAKVNPASWITRDLLAEQRETLPEGAFLRFHANSPDLTPEGAWLPAGAYQRCIGEPRFEEGETLHLALDVGGEESATALLWASESLQVGCRIGYGDEAIFGARERIAELRESFQVVELCADPWRAKQLMLELEREGLRCVELPQTDSRMCPASDRLRRAIMEERLVLPDDSELTRHASNAVQRHTRRGWRIDKPDRSSPVDGMVSLAMLLERIEERAPPVRFHGWA